MEARVCARERGEHGAVGIRQLAGSEFCWGRDEFFARRNDRYARAAVDRDGINASGGESGDYGGVDKRAGCGHWRAGLDILPGRANM